MIDSTGSLVSKTKSQMEEEKEKGEEKESKKIEPSIGMKNSARKKILTVFGLESSLLPHRLASLY